MSSKAIIKRTESWPDVANQDSRLMFPLNFSEGCHYEMRLKVKWEAPYFQYSCLVFSPPVGNLCETPGRQVATFYNEFLIYEAGC